MCDLECHVTASWYPKGQLMRGGTRTRSLRISRRSTDHNRSTEQSSQTFRAISFSVRNSQLIVR